MRWRACERCDRADVHSGGDWEGPDTTVRALSKLVAGARFAPDADGVPVVTARWLYTGVKQETRQMARVGLAS